MTTLTFNKSEAIKKAQVYLRATLGENEMRQERGEITELAQKLQNHSVFSYARRLYQLLHEHFPKDEKITEKLAVCTYKDSDLSSDIKFDAAAKLLIANFSKHGEFSDSNILGVMGSIYKKKWKYDNHEGHLYQSLRYYQEGFSLALNNKEAHEKLEYQSDEEKEAILKKIKRNVLDAGYCGINSALVFNLLAQLDSFQLQKDENGFEPVFKSGYDPLLELTEQFQTKAKEVRTKVEQIYREFYESFSLDWQQQDPFFANQSRYWYLVTWGEALLGLGHFDEAKEKFEAALKLKNTPGWMIHSTRIQSHDLADILFGSYPEKFDAAKSSIRGLFMNTRMPKEQGLKYGLALSGGGFRASIFHIGVLAKLAEADLLGQVEVISCVSGGSILGAYYYLELKKLMEEKADEKITKADYIDLVKRIEKDFLDKVNRNVRLNVLSNLWVNVKMALLGDYTRTNRTAALYDKFLYDGILPGKKNILMEDLLIQPKGVGPNFRPDRDNWKREHKVPILILNATTLNTGHSWQFTATWMGESPAYIGSEFDALPNLRRMWYTEAPPGYRKLQLSTAVAASAGVPGLFAPITFKNLYEGYNKVLLVDGGVHDNQGISTLYEQECNTLIISDASGQMLADTAPPSNEFGVFGRTNSILQERIRFSQFRDLEARKQSGVIRGFILMHLTKGLPGEVVNWEQCDDPYKPPIFTEEKEGGTAVWTDYNIRKSIQTLLAQVRTDLDAFHESEAYMLMYSGYRMVAREMKLASGDLFKKSSLDDIDRGNHPEWDFMQVEEAHQDSEKSQILKKKLEPSSKLFGKLLDLNLAIRIVAYVLVGGLLVGLCLLLLQCFPETIQVSHLKFYGLLGALGILIERGLSRLTKSKSFALCLIFWLFPLLILGVISWLVSLFSTKLYLFAGRLPKK